MTNSRLPFVFKSSTVLLVWAVQAVLGYVFFNEIYEYAGRMFPVVAFWVTILNLAFMQISIKLEAMHPEDLQTFLKEGGKPESIAAKRIKAEEEAKKDGSKLARPSKEQFSQQSKKVTVHDSTPVDDIAEQQLSFIGMDEGVFEDLEVEEFIAENFPGQEIAQPVVNKAKAKPKTTRTRKQQTNGD